MVVGDWVASTPLDEVITGCEAAAVPVGLVQTVGQYLEHPQVAARDSVVRIDQPGVGPVTVSGVVPRLMDTPGLIETLGAVLGGTTVDDVLERWGGAPYGATTTGETP